MNKLIKKTSQISDLIRYMLNYLNNNMESWYRTKLNEPSSSDSDKYKELLISPTILMIAKQQGEIYFGRLDL